jgi:hypothetical protein
LLVYAGFVYAGFVFAASSSRLLIYRRGPKSIVTFTTTSNTSSTNAAVPIHILTFCHHVRVVPRVSVTRISVTVSVFDL